MKDKKLNAFLKNHNDEAAYDIIDDDHKDSFLDLLTHAYINVLRKENTEWKDSIDNYCKNKITFQKFQSIKNNFNININDKDVKKSEKDMCPFIIKKIIHEKKKSYPIKLKLLILRKKT